MAVVPVARPLARVGTAASRVKTCDMMMMMMMSSSHCGVMKATKSGNEKYTSALSQGKKKQVIDLTGGSQHAGNEREEKTKTMKEEEHSYERRLGRREQDGDAGNAPPCKSQKRRKRAHSGSRSDNVDVRMLTWNVWFGQLAMEQRMVSIGDTVGRLSPDVVAFQECTMFSHTMLRSQSWWNEYEEFVSPDRNPAYYEVLLVKKPEEDSHIRRRRRGGEDHSNDNVPSSSSSSSSKIRTEEFASYQLRSHMGRNLLLARGITINGCSFTVGTAHLESPCPDARGVFQLHCRERKHQMKQVMSSIGASSQQDRAAGGRAISSFSMSQPSDGESDAPPPKVHVIMGDMNWDERNDGPILDAGSGWVDAWTTLRSDDEPGFTYDAKLNGNLSGGLRRRLDRILVKCFGNDDVVTLASIEMVGCEPVEPALHHEKRIGKKTKIQRVFASDHFGLLLTLNVRDVSRQEGVAPPPPGTAIHTVF